MSTTTEASAGNTTPTNEELKRVFDQFDANKDGYISVTELRDVLIAMGSNYSEDELRRVMDDIDNDKDGYINFSEFSTFWTSSSDAGTAVSELKEAFDMYDVNGNGLISATELHQVLNRLGMSFTVEDCVGMIKSVDSDNDGHVNFEEFKKMMSASSASGSGGGSKP
ncbi:putative calcium-binding protein CML26 [Hibiscus syriacus]|uniref:Calcium-binding protein CML26 n=1 Tax=Hibiscus syriacus TaxID=106335 RepID=A0A6A2XJS8_HIBSY|nr:probable calcium-binding protein CML27 [Hibiscus syriacus]KAE8662266.1 putative calcium-binding protein CML26 [Hibiscus syriacus]